MRSEDNKQRMFCEVVKKLLRRKARVSNLDIRDPDCLTELIQAEDTIKHECPKITNVRIGTTSTNFEDQKLATLKVSE